MIKEKNIWIENIYNIYKMSFLIDVVQRSYVIVNKDTNIWYQTQPGQQEWTNVVKYICTNGSAILPFIILKGKKVMSS